MDTQTGQDQIRTSSSGCASAFSGASASTWMSTNCAALIRDTVSVVAQGAM